jgi:hypothetical protein
MGRKAFLTGEMVQGEQPDWQPLEDLVGTDVVGDFMWMYEVALSDGRSLHAYKHVDTRRYIHMTADRSAFAYEPERRYLPVPAEEVLAEVFASLVGLAGVTARQLAASWASVARLDPSQCPPPPEPKVEMDMM